MAKHQTSELLSGAISDERSGKSDVVQTIATLQAIVPLFACLYWKIRKF